MCTVVVAGEPELRVPEDVTDLASFRRWVYSDEFPEKGRVAFLQGEIWVDMNAERLQSHSRLKLRYHRVLDEIIEDEELGLFFPDGALWTNKGADVCNIPDGMFLSWDALESGRVRYVGEHEEAIEVEGSPDMVMEVVSRSSVHKDTVSLMKSYWAAGVKEYWLVDARGRIPEFRILVRGPRGFRDSSSKGDWHRSAVFAREFKLERRIGRLGHAAYELKVR